MIASLLYSITRLLVDLLSVRDREQAELQAEVLALRHQLRVLQRQVRRPRWRPGDRMVVATIIGWPAKPEVGIPSDPGRAA